MVGGVPPEAAPTLKAEVLHSLHERLDVVETIGDEEHQPAPLDLLGLESFLGQHFPAADIPAPIVVRIVTGTFALPPNM